MRITPRQYRWITLAALVLLSVIVVTGAAVRLTGSGLGCPQWPNCEPGRLTPHSATDTHAMVEFVNRTFTGLVSIGVILAVLGSLIRSPRRRDLTWWSLGLVAGVIGQIVLGGLTVLFELRPPFVMGHFMLSMVLVANAVVLHVRAGQLDEDRTVVRAPLRIRRVLGGVYVAAAFAVFFGTVVTAAGPHGGDERAIRLSVDIGWAARVHSLAVWVLVGLTVVGIVWSRRDRAVRNERSLWWLAAVMVPQGIVGYVQYFTGVPEVLVGVHILGATLVWIAATAAFLTRTQVVSSRTGAAERREVELVGQ